MTPQEKQALQYKKMTETPIPRLIGQLCIPTIISMLITSIYNAADTAFVGQLGTSPSGAVGVVFGFMAIVQAVGFLFGQGAGSILSRLLGGQDVEEASRVGSTGFFCALFAGLLISVTGFLTLDGLVKILGSTPTIAPYAKQYITWILLATPLMTTSFVLNNLLRYEGKAALGMVGLLTGSLLNIALDPILMFGLELGVSGAGIATAFSQTVSFCILLSMFLRGKTQSRLSFRCAVFSAPMLLNIAATGLPSLLRQGLGSITTMVLNLECGVYGDEAVAAMSIVSRVVMMMFSLGLGIGQGFQPVSGFNYGAKKYKRVREAFRFTVLLSEAVIIVVSVTVLLLSGDVIRLFRDDPAVIEIGTRALRLQCGALIVFPVCMSMEMLLQSTGQRFQASLLSSLRNGAFFLPALLILARVRGLAGIQEAQPLAYLLTVIPAVVLGVWFFRRLPKENF